MLNRLKAASKDNLVLSFAGVGSAFAKKNAQTSLIVAKDGMTLLVDIGATIPGALFEQSIAVTDFDHYHITHSHADHIGGVEELLLLSRYTARTKPSFIITPNYEEMLWHDSLSGGCAYNELGLLEFSDFITPVRPRRVESQLREMYEVTLGNLHLLIFRTKHIPGDVTNWDQAFWSTGLLVDRRVLFTADTRFDPSLFSDLEAAGFSMKNVEAIFHDCQLTGPGAVHATYNELRTLPSALKRKIYLTHYGDTFEQFNPLKDGFRGFAQPWHLYEFAPQPVTMPQKKGTKTKCLTNNPSNSLTKRSRQGFDSRSLSRSEPKAEAEFLPL